MAEVEAPVVDMEEELVVALHEQVEPAEVVLMEVEPKVLIKVDHQLDLQIMLQDEEVELAVLVVDMM